MGIALDYYLFKGAIKDPEPMYIRAEKWIKRKIYDWIRPPGFMPRYCKPAVNGI
jgi:hypothetical protein